MNCNKYFYTTLLMVCASIGIFFASCKKEYNTAIQCNLTEVNQNSNNLSLSWKYSYDPQGKLLNCTSPYFTSPYYHNYTYGGPVIIEIDSTLEGGSYAIFSIHFVLNENGYVTYGYMEIIDSIYYSPQWHMYKKSYSLELKYTDDLLTHITSFNDYYNEYTNSHFYTYHIITRSYPDNENCTLQTDSLLKGSDLSNLMLDGLTTTKFEYTDKLNSQNIDFGGNNFSPQIYYDSEQFNSKLFGKSNKNLLSKRTDVYKNGTTSVATYQYEFNQYNYITKYILSYPPDVYSYTFKYDCYVQ